MSWGWLRLHTTTTGQDPTHKLELQKSRPRLLKQNIFNMETHWIQEIEWLWAIIASRRVFQHSLEAFLDGLLGSWDGLLALSPGFASWKLPLYTWYSWAPRYIPSNLIPFCLRANCLSLVNWQWILWQIKLNGEMERCPVLAAFQGASASRCKTTRGPEMTHSILIVSWNLSRDCAIEAE